MNQSETADTDRDAGVVLWGLVVTYRRPIQLASTLKALAEQTRHIDHLVVVDNGSDAEAHDVADAAGATYLDAGDNLGPAGGMALGMQYIFDQAGAADWLVLIDDDDPPRNANVIQHLIAFGRSRAAEDARLAGVGLAGARYDPGRGVVKRLSDKELAGPTRVDYIGGGQFPTLRVAVARQVGVFDGALFFGFEELEYGLRLGAAGYSLYVDGDVWKASRCRSGRLNYPKERLKTPSNTSAWRRYYGPRNVTLIARRYARAWAPLLTAGGGGTKGALVLARQGRPLREVWLPILGAAHGLLGRSGRVVDPGQAQKVN